MVKFNTNEETIDASKKNVVINSAGVVNGKTINVLQVNDATSKKIVKFDKVVSITTDKGTTTIDHTKPIMQVLDTVRNVVQKQFEEDKSNSSSKIKVYLLNNGQNAIRKDPPHGAQVRYTVAAILEVEAGTGFTEIIDQMEPYASAQVKLNISNWNNTEASARTLNIFDNLGVLGNTECVAHKDTSNGQYSLSFDVNKALSGLSVGDTVDTEDYPNDYFTGCGYQASIYGYQKLNNLKTVAPEDSYHSNIYLDDDVDNEIPLCDGVAFIVG